MPSFAGVLRARLTRVTVAGVVIVMTSALLAAATATITTDKNHYSVGEPMLISGSGFTAGQSIGITVLRPDRLTDVVLNVFADATGSFSARYTPSTPAVPGRYRITATDSTSSATTAATEADASSANLDQCRNGGATSPTDCVGSQWENGNVNATQAHMIEGWSVPYRMRFTDAFPGSTWTVELGYDVTQNGKHAIDFLTQYNRLNDPSHQYFFGHAPECIDPTDGFGTFGGQAGVCDPPNPTSIMAIPKPDLPNLNPTPPPLCAGGTSAGSPTAGNSSCAGRSFDAIALAGGEVFSMWGGTITSIQYVYQAQSQSGGSAETRIRLIFTSSATDGKVVLSWGGHIARYLDWGTGNSASGISGSPYHMRLNGFCSGTPSTCDTGGNQDRGLAAAAVLVPPSLTLVKNVVNNSGGTAQTEDWTLTAAGPVTISGTGGSAAVTNALVQIGTYTLSESSGPAGYTPSQYSCVKNGAAAVVGNSITLAAGDTATCTITNDDQPAHLTLQKTVDNTNGGAKTINDFPLTATGPTTITGVSGATAVTNAVVSAGTYTLSEQTQTGYLAGAWACTGGALTGSTLILALGDSATCSITNTSQQAFVIVNKVVVNDNGGAAKPDDFKLTLDGKATTSGTKVAVSPGTHTAAETQLAGYTFTGFSGDCDTSGNVTVALGETKTCTLTNDDQPAYVTVIKKVINDNGGSALPDDFKLTLDGKATTSGTKVAVNPGTHVAAETSLPGYTFVGYSGDCDTSGNVTVALGETKTCTLTNDDQQAYVTVIKKVINDNGGSALPDDFKLTLDGKATTSGTKVAVNPGTHIAAETTLPGYTFVGYSGDCDSNGNVAVALGDNKTCTLTNDDQQAYVIVNKEVVNDNGGSAKPDDFKLTLDGNATTSGTKVPVNPGTHTAAETQLAGYTFIGFSIDCDSAGKVTVALGQTKTCTLTNDDQQASVIVNKVVVNDNGGSAKPDDFKLTLDGKATTSGTIVPVNPGTHTAAETALSGYTFKGFSGACDTNGNVTVALGETKTCTLTNDDEPAYVIVKKTVINDNGGSAKPDDFKLTLDGNATTSGTPVAVNPGSHTANETQLAGYEFRGFGGDCDSTGKVVAVSGQTKTCTLTNDDQQAYIIVTKTVINNNGGSAKPDDFKLTLDGNATTSGTPIAVNPGSHTANETQLAGYGFSGFGGDCDSTGKVTAVLGQTKTCVLTNDDQPAYVIVRKMVVNNNGGSALPNDFKLTLDGGAVSSGVGVAVTPGAHKAGETQLPGYQFAGFGGDCDSAGNITAVLGQTKTCTLTNDDQQAYIVLNKVVVNDNGGTATADDFKLTLNNVGTTSGTPIAVNPGTYTAGETLLYGYKFIGFSGNCNTSGLITVALGQTATCTLTNDDQPGTIVIVKNATPANGTFTFQTTGTGYQGFTINGGPVTGQSNSQPLNAGTYSVKELTQLGWTLDAIGGSTDTSTPNACKVTGTGGSSGTGDVNTQTATISLKIGDTVTCVFENTGNGATRTQGFWATHSQLAKLAWLGGTGYGHSFPGVASTIGDVMLCGRPIDTIEKVEGGFWSDISKTTANAKRSPLDQARMQLLQQLLAAELNASAFGSAPKQGSFSAWESAYCGTSQNAIQTAMQQASSFNSQGDSSTFTPGTAADSKYARTIANELFWDLLP